MDWCHSALLLAIVIFIVSLIIFFKRIAIHATQGNGFYDYNKETNYRQRKMYGAGTDERAWIDRPGNETNVQCPPAYCEQLRV
jgi:hypothetical protein